MGEEAEGCDLADALEPFTVHVVDETRARGIEGVEIRRFRQGTRKTGLDGFNYRKLFYGNKG